MAAVKALVQPGEDAEKVAHDLDGVGGGLLLNSAKPGTDILAQRIREPGE